MSKPTAARELAQWLTRNFGKWGRMAEISAELDRLAEVEAKLDRLAADYDTLADERDRLREALRGLADYLDECAAIEDNDPDVCAELRIKAAEAREKAEGR